MKTHGVKILDRVLGTSQLDWLVVLARDCPDEVTERRFVSTRFRVPHEPWGPSGAYVRPINIRRSRRRVVFRQESGIGP